MSKRERIVANLMRELGTYESPQSSNVIKYNDWYYDVNSDTIPKRLKQIAKWYHNLVAQKSYKSLGKNFAWCGTFVAYVFHFSDVYLDTGLFNCISYVPAAQNWLIARGKKRDFLLDAKAGDLIIFDWNKDGFEDHIGVFIEWEGDYAITVEGNTSPNNAGSQSNGGMVCKRKRHKSSIEGIYNVIGDDE